MGRNRFRTNHTNCMPGPELCGQFFAALGVRKCPQFGVDARLKNENAQGYLSAGIRPAKLRLLSYGYIVASDVRFGSKADMCTAPAHVRFTPESRHLLECALDGGQFHAAVLTGCWPWRSSYCAGLR